MLIRGMSVLVCDEIILSCFFIIINKKCMYKHNKKLLVKDKVQFFFFFKNPFGFWVMLEKPLCTICFCIVVRQASVCWDILHFNSLLFCFLWCFGLKFAVRLMWILHVCQGKFIVIKMNLCHLHYLNFICRPPEWARSFCRLDSWGISWSWQSK